MAKCHWGNTTAGYTSTLYKHVAGNIQVFNTKQQTSVCVCVCELSSGINAAFMKVRQIWYWRLNQSRVGHSFKIRLPACTWTVNWVMFLTTNTILVIIHEIKRTLLLDYPFSNKCKQLGECVQRMCTTNMQLSNINWRPLGLYYICFMSTSLSVITFSTIPPQYYSFIFLWSLIFFYYCKPLNLK